MYFAISTRKVQVIFGNYSDTIDKIKIFFKRFVLKIEKEQGK